MITDIKIESYTLIAMTGRKIRKSVRVVFPDGYVVPFLDPIPKREAIRQAIIWRKREEQRTHGQ